MTGRPAAAAVSSGSAEVHTFSDRQSSLCGSDDAGSDALVMPAAAGGWGAIGPNAAASRIPSQGSGDCGARQRNSPTGGRA